MIKLKKQNGFTLIEIAIVLLIVSILLGYTVSMYSVQSELKDYRKAEKEVDQIAQALIGFAQVNGRLPCPDTDNDGYENGIDIINNLTGVAVQDGANEDCTNFVGTVPRGTLGLSGSIDAAGNMVDPWGQAYRYHVSAVNTASVAIDLVSPNDIRNEGLAAVVNNPPDLFICDDSDNAAVYADCTVAGTGNSVMNNASVIIFSTGKDIGGIGSNIQNENTDGDLLYTKGGYSEAAGNEYDDIIKWISPNTLYSKMIEAGQLP